MKKISKFKPITDRGFIPLPSLGTAQGIIFYNVAAGDTYHLEVEPPQAAPAAEPEQPRSEVRRLKPIPGVQGFDLMGLDSADLMRIAIRAARPGQSRYALFTAAAGTLGVGPVSPQFLWDAFQYSEAGSRAAFSRLPFYSFVADQAVRMQDPVEALHVFERLPSAGDPVLAVWVDFLAHHEQAYLTLEIRKATLTQRRNLRNALEQAIQRKRREEGIDFKGLHVQVAAMETVVNGLKPFTTNHFKSNAQSALRLVYGRSQARLEALSAGHKAVVVADDLDEKSRKLQKAAALLATLDALLTGQAKPGTLLSAARFLGERMGLLRQLDQIVSQSA